MNTASRQKSGDVRGVCILEGATKFPPQILCVASDLNVELILVGENRKEGGGKSYIRKTPVPALNCGAIFFPPMTEIHDALWEIIMSAVIFSNVLSH